MEPGVLALVGIFALAAVFGVWGFMRGRSVERRLAALGFEPCDEEAPALEAAWRALAGCDSSQELRFARCCKRAAGRRMLHHFTVNERPEERTSSETTNPGATYPAFLFDLCNPDSVCRGAVSLYVLPPGSKVLRKLLASVISLSQSRTRLEVGDYPWSATIVAAHGRSADRLDDLVPAGIQEKLARAAAHGFFILHLGDGKAAFAALSNHHDVDLQMAYLDEWV